MISSYRPFYNWAELSRLLRPGPGREAFEAALAERAGARYGLAFSYARSGLVALFKALGFEQAEIIMPAYTCSSVAEAVVFSGNKPLFVDIDLADYNINIQAIKSALTPQTRAIIATHMFGYPVDVAAIRAEVGDERIMIIEDAALALPTRLTGGDVLVFSLGQGKQLYTISGGVVVTNSSQLYEQLKTYRSRAMNQRPNSVWARRCGQIGTAYLAQSGRIEEQLVRLKNMGPVKQARANVGLVRQKIPHDYNVAFSDFQARLGLAQLAKLDTVLERARARAQFYGHALQDMAGVTPPPLHAQATYAYYSVRVAGRDRLRLIQRMRERGIEVGRNFDYALPGLEVYRGYAQGRSFPNAEQAAREVINLPNYPGVTAQEAGYIVESIRHIMQAQEESHEPITHPSHQSV
jgi:dTDP-4-amino-4,6-dideoxygalactose transaminase